MKVVSILNRQGKTYRVLQNAVGLYFAQKKFGLMDWQFYKDWYGNKIFVSIWQAEKYIDNNK